MQRSSTTCLGAVYLVCRSGVIDGVDRSTRCLFCLAILSSASGEKLVDPLVFTALFCFVKADASFISVALSVKIFFSLDHSDKSDHPYLRSLRDYDSCCQWQPFQYYLILYLQLFADVLLSVKEIDVESTRKISGSPLATG